jgi:hypothetical protein
MLRHAVVLQGIVRFSKSWPHRTVMTLPRRAAQGGCRDQRDGEAPTSCTEQTGAAGAAADRPGPGRDSTIQLEDTDELTASFQVGFIQDIVLVLTVAATPAGREQAVVFTGADAASRFQRRSSAAPALFLMWAQGRRPTGA